MSERSILHINVVNFFVSIARVINPKLRSYPVAVVTSGSSRRMLIDISAEAYQAGVRRGMQVEVAKRICGDLIIISQSPSSEYERAATILIKEAGRLSPLAEPAGPGHVFVDLTGTRRLLGAPVSIAEQMRRHILKELQVDCAVGVATNRLVSKIATRVIKPIGLCTVIDGCEEEFMAPLPLTFLPSIEERILRQLLQFNFNLIRDLVSIPAKTLSTVLGPIAYDINRHARGIDTTPVRAFEQSPPSVRDTITLEEQTNDYNQIACALFQLVGRCALSVRKMGLSAGALTVKIVYADNSSLTKKAKLCTPLRSDLSLFEQASGIFKRLFTRRVRLSALSLELSDLTFPYGQLDLFINTEKEEHLMSAIDTIRTTYGQNAISFWGREVA